MGINAKQSLRGNVTSNQTLSGNVVGTLGLVGKTNIGGDVEHYDGDYEVTPKITAQTLLTKEKYMTEDVTVKEIPYAEVTNLANGITVTIGKEV